MMVFVVNLIINIDHGVMPAGANVIREDLQETYTEYGLLGSIVFAGLVCGSLAATFAFRNVDTRIVISAAILLNACA